jgi:hypothetical protein
LRFNGCLQLLDGPLIIAIIEQLHSVCEITSELSVYLGWQDGQNQGNKYTHSRQEAVRSRHP